MAFPTTSAVIDNFNRANENPISTPWDGGITQAGATLKIVSNQLAGEASAIAQGRLDGFGADVEIQLECRSNLVEFANVTLYARVTDPGSGAWLGYDLFIQENASSSTWTISGLQSPIDTGVASGPLLIGEKIGLSCVGTTISAHKFTGGSWSQVVTYNNNWVAGAGALGVRCQSGAGEVILFDNLIGGAAVASGGAGGPDSSINVGSRISPSENATGRRLK